MDTMNVISIIALMVGILSLSISLIAFAFQRKIFLVQKKTEYLSTILELQMIYTENERILNKAKLYENDSYEQYRIAEHIENQKINLNKWKDFYKEYSERKIDNDIVKIEKNILEIKQEMKKLEEYQDYLSNYLENIMRSQT